MSTHYLMKFHIKCMQTAPSLNVVSSATYYQVPYPFNLKIKSRPDVAVEENKVGTVTSGTTIFIYREDPNGWVEFSLKRMEKILTLKSKLICN